jgi:hypothetical protein
MWCYPLSFTAVCECARPLYRNTLGVDCVSWEGLRYNDWVYGALHHKTKIEIQKLKLWIN